MSLFLADETDYTIEQIVQIVREQLTEPYRTSDNLRTAVMYSPKTMTRADFIEACALVGINKGSANNRYSEVRNWQKELGEI